VTSDGSSGGGSEGGRLRAILLGVFLSVALLSAAELALRIAWPDLEVERLAPAFPELFDHLDNVHHEPDPELLWRLRPGYEEEGVRVGAAGFRGLPGAQDPEQWRVAALGDSVTFGYSNPRYEDTWPARLEGLVSARCATHISVLNAGITGYSSEQGRRLYQRRFSEVSPDVVILLYGYNDHHLSGASDATKLEAGPGAGALRWLRDLSLARALRKLSFEWLALAPDRSLEPRVAPSRFRENLRGLIAEIRERDAVPVLMTIPIRPGIPLVENPVRITTLAGAEGWVSPIRWLERRLPPGAGEVLLSLVFTGTPPETAWLGRVEPHLVRAVDAAPEQALPRFVRGLARHARGDAAGAHDDFAAALELDGERRTLTAYNDDIREIGAETGSAVVDLEAALVVAERRGQPPSFHDVVHLTARGNAIAAAALAPVVARALGCEPAAGSALPSGHPRRSGGSDVLSDDPSDLGISSPVRRHSRRPLEHPP
jgi:lysophospholipase L1-like esterase